MARDYYEILGVARSASSDEIKRAYRQLARQYHPDVSKETDAEVKFKEINEAYAILCDEEKRSRYDRFGEAGVNGSAGFGGGAAGFGGFEDIFEDLFSTFVGRSQSTRRGPRPGSDIGIEMTISFEEAVFGVEKEVEFRRLESCSVCNGTGAKEGSQPVTCPDCHGAGEVKQVRQTFVGSVVRVTPCPRCGGRGNIIKDPCTTCDGSGRHRKTTKQNIKVPAGVYDGLRIQIRGEGDVGEQGAPSGSLQVLIRVDEHAFFKRRDNDIILDWNINISQASLGDVITIPTLEGDVELKIPHGTQTGKVFRLRGKGVPRLRSDGSSSGRGDQLVYVQVAVPTNLTDRQRELFEELAETFGEELQVQHTNRGFFDRMMDFLTGDQGHQG